MRETVQDGSTQAIESKRRKSEKLKPREVSPLLKQVIVDRFYTTKSTQEVADWLHKGGVNIDPRGVLDVLLRDLYEQLRKGPQPRQMSAERCNVLEFRRAG